jgi:hypothetical protein
LKPEWWGVPLVQEKKYQGKKETSVKNYGGGGGGGGGSSSSSSSNNYNTE